MTAKPTKPVIDAVSTAIAVIVVACALAILVAATIALAGWIL